MRGKKIDRAAVLRDLQAIEDEDYDGFVLLVRAARNRNVTFDPGLPAWRVAQTYEDYCGLQSWWHCRIR